uniref:DUF148 domain-containing protein n=1 Tax=Caenorhabditis tropicalis TaxID=1561998 RepID=A0A1I7U8L0_9PELO
MLLRFVVLFIVTLFVFVSSSESSEGGPPPPPGNETMMEPPMGNGTEPNGIDSVNGTIVQENGNKTGGVMDWIKSKLGK